MGEVGGKCGGGPLISNQVAALDAFDVPRPSWKHDMHDPWYLSSHLPTPGQEAALTVFDALAGLHSMCDPDPPLLPPCW